MEILNKNVKTKRIGKHITIITDEDGFQKKIDWRKVESVKPEFFRYDEPPFEAEYRTRIRYNGKEDFIPGLWTIEGKKPVNMIYLI